MKEKISKNSAISMQTFRRLPGYYNYLKMLSEAGVENVSAPSIAAEMHLNEVQVRKDLAAVSPLPGIPRRGFVVEELLVGIGSFLGYYNRDEALLVGAGNLGRALMLNKSFEDHGLYIVAACDKDPDLLGKKIGNKKVYSINRIASLCKRLKTRIGIIAVPPEEAQKVCDLMVDNGILAIWNFAPVHLRAPDGVLIQNENMEASMALLSQHLFEQDEFPQVADIKLD